MASHSMDNRRIKIAVAFFTVMIISCNEPETIVTNYIHSDGSVTRKIEMRSTAKKIAERFKTADLQVPFDTTWSVTDSCQSGEKGDTIWIRRAVKIFKNVAEINLTYENDSGANRKISRRAIFKKKFKWFNTELRFAEIIDKSLSYGYPISDFLDNEELSYFYSPDKVKYNKEIGPDSLKYKALSDSIKVKVDLWTMKNLVSGWIGEFSKLTYGKEGGDSASEAFLAHEDQLVKMIIKNEINFDSLWSNGIILKKFIGEAGCNKFKADADTALGRVTGNLVENFREYSERIAMPGKVMATNGHKDSDGVLLWTVKANFFMTEPYEMWAESKVRNNWIWITSVLILLVIIAPSLFMKIKRADLHQPSKQI
jgi:hypothetical protein